jgi:hypothetical protein
MLEEKEPEEKGNPSPRRGWVKKTKKIFSFESYRRRSTRRIPAFKPPILH